MTAAAVPTNDYRVRFSGIVHAEFGKTWTVKAAWIVYSIIAALGIGITVLNATLSSEAPTDPATAILSGSLMLGLVIALHAITTVTGEYGTGSIRTTMSAVPKRLPVLFAKSLLTAVTVTVYFVVLNFAMLVTAKLVSDLSAFQDLSLTASSTLEPLFHGTAATVFFALIAVMIGFILRNTAGSLAFFIGVVVLMPDLLRLIPWDGMADIVQWSPMNLPNAPVFGFGELTSGQSYMGMGLWVLVLGIIACVSLKKRDV
ncbi:hypothetical protein [Salininema proteolyticum]|uniref:ABC-2 type transport system permease protein n=1 Tax=Salininema proteolyticum TaxID=1607685 RepID=A0ABV8U3C4_9ACTN